jgi:hypothetical protein
MTQVLENNNKLIGELIGLLKTQQTPLAKPVVKSEVRRKEASPKQKRAKSQAKQAQKAKPEKPKKKGLFSFLRGK